jgi:uncharacterized protein YndB with AHSA1/START domain
MPVVPDRMLCMTRRFAAPPERVFAAWIDPEMVKRWLFAGPTDERYQAEIDGRVGGTWTIIARRDGVDYTATGEYLEIDPPRRLVFTFAMPQFSPNSDRLIVELSPDGDGCLMTFTQEGVDIAEELRQVPAGDVGGSEAGWTLMFRGLEEIVESI